MNLDLDRVPTPCYVCDSGLLERNLETLAAVTQRSGSKVLLALKGFAMFSLFPLCRRYLQGSAASSLHEARLGREEFGGELHLYSPAYIDAQFPELLELADFVSFNSFSQWERFRPLVASSGKRTACGIRINPECSGAPVELYDPCARYSRLGVTRTEFREEGLEGISGVLIHALCAQNADALERIVDVLNRNFAAILERMDWINLGGGHHITREDYDVDRLCGIVGGLRERFGVEVYLEPGEAVALDAGVLVASVLDIVHNEIDVAILDTSATAHMPDVLEMPYRPRISGAGPPGEYDHSYRLAGSTCLAGDTIGDYSFPKPLSVGSKIVFHDMAHYTMVKNNTFNGVGLPSIAIRDPGSDDVRIVRRFEYEDYKGRLS